MTSEPATTESPTIDEVVTLLQHWRDNKDQYEGRGIPDEIWHKTFALENSGRFSAAVLKRTFGLSSQQYKTKKTELLSPVPTPLQPSPPDGTNDVAAPEPAFCEAIISPDTPPTVPALTPEESQRAQKTKKDIARLKSTHQRPEDYLDTSTIIVEYIRPDGHRLRIHTTTKSINQVMQSFGAEGAAQV